MRVERREYPHYSYPAKRFAIMGTFHTGGPRLRGPCLPSQLPAYNAYPVDAQAYHSPAAQRDTRAPGSRHSCTRQNLITDVMEIASEKDAERANLLCWFKQIGDHYGHHASRRGRADADVRVFEGQT